MRKIVFQTRWTFKQTSPTTFEVELSPNGTTILNPEWVKVNQLTDAEVLGITEDIVRKLMILD